eukprot:12191692-Ditylum_brightwellii.AAC.1
MFVTTLVFKEDSNSSGQQCASNKRGGGSSGSGAGALNLEGKQMLQSMWGYEMVVGAIKSRLAKFPCA